MYHKHAIVIGNAPVDTKLGHVIDTFGTVIRINHFKQGYEEFVGKKTDILSIGHIKEPDPLYTCDVWLAFPAHGYTYCYGQAAHMYEGRVQDIHVSIIKDLQKKAGFNTDFPKYFTTTGLTTIELAIHMLSCPLPIYTYGFKLIQDNYHVRGGNSIVHPDRIPCHDMKKDRAYYLSMIEQGMVKELR